MIQSLQQSIVLKTSTISFATLLLQANRKLSYFQQNADAAAKPITVAKAKTVTKDTEEKYRLSILYPGRQPNLSTDSFFSCPQTIIKEQTKKRKLKLQQQRRRKMDVEFIKKQSHSGRIASNYTAPRNPIVLCHGLFGFDIRGPENIPALQFHYWSGVEDTLAKLGAKVIVTKVPQAGSIWERSHALHTILKSIAVGKNVNFVAHSMGGLDCRHLLANFHDRPYNVKSLTTISTPHRGSPVMDWFRDNVGVGLSQAPPGQHNNWAPAAASTMSTMSNTMRGDCVSVPTSSNASKWTARIPSLKPTLDNMIVKWFDEPAYAHLTTDFCNEYFNPNTPDDPSVKYYSYGAAAQIPAWSSLLGLPWQMVKEKEGDNDGIVSVQSAKWGTYVKTIQADHWDLSGKSHIPYRLNNPITNTGREFDRLDFYAEMATHLYNQGH